MIHTSAIEGPRAVFLGVQTPSLFFFGSLHFSPSFPFPGTQRPGFGVICCLGEEDVCWKWVKYINRFYNLLFCGTHVLKLRTVNVLWEESGRVAKASGALFPQVLPSLHPVISTQLLVGLPLCSSFQFQSLIPSSRPALLEIRTISVTKWKATA